MCLYNTIAKSSGTCKFCCRRFAFYGFLGTIVTTENFFTRAAISAADFMCLYIL